MIFSDSERSAASVFAYEKQTGDFMELSIINNPKSHLTACVSVSAIVASLMAPQFAFAQGSGASVDDEVVVTGTRIPSANAVATSPVTTIGNVEFDIRGTTRVEDLVNTLPQAFAAQGANTSNGATGTAQVSLRGLGATRTLVLINGRRMQYGSMISSAPDLNQIPSALIDHVDVLTGGASAVYGSDAIAGVVNFTMINDFEGVRIDGQLSGYQHSNNNDAAQARLNAAAASPSFGSDLSIPKSGVFDGKGQEITLIIGANTADGRGNVTAYAGYRNNDAILQADRDYSKCAYADGDPDFTCSGSSTTPLGRFFSAVPYSGLPSAFYGLDTTNDESNPGLFRPRTGADTFNFNPTNFYQRPDERFTLGAFAHYTVNEHLEFYSEAMFYDYHSDAQIAFTGTFFTTSQINCDNPLISASPNASGYSQLDYLCGQADLGADGFVGRRGPDNISGTADDLPSTYTPDDFLIPGSGSTAAGDVTFYPGKRFVEGLPRNSSIRNTSYRLVGGLRGDAFPGWRYDAYFQYGTTRGSNTFDNDAVIPNIQDALFAVSDGMGGIQCRSASARAQGCVPLNLFTVGGVNQSQLNYILQQSFQGGATQQYVGEVSMTGDLGQYGFKTPWSSDGVGVAFGWQWRKDSLEFNPDALFQRGLLSGQGGPTPAVSGSIETTDFYAEAEIPLVTDMPFAQRFSFNGGYRHSNVSTSGGYSTWKLAGDWQVTPEIRVRGGWQRAARAANVIEAFAPQAIGLTTLDDGCALGSASPYTAAGCANTNGGLPLAPGSIPANPANQYNALFGGNQNLSPEVSDTYTVGVVLTPQSLVPGNLFVSADYFNITVDGYINTVNPQTALDQCANSGDAFFCSLIHRAPNGSLWINPQGFITATNLNTGSLSTSGIDINANWNVDFSDLGLGGAGGLGFDFVGTYLIDLNTLQLPDGTVPEYDCAGYYAGRCSSLFGGPNPTWRHKLRTTWKTPFGVDASITWRYFASVYQGDSVSGRTAAVTDLDYKLGTRNYIDLAASYGITDKWRATIGVNNLLDKDPPVTSQAAGFSNGNTYPQTYDAQGRYLFLSTTIDF
ncbi:MAG: TonB-dependent receptor [Parvularculaceae bacterium]